MFHTNHFTDDPIINGVHRAGVLAIEPVEWKVLKLSVYLLKKIYSEVKFTGQTSELRQLIVRRGGRASPFSDSKCETVVYLSSKTPRHLNAAVCCRHWVISIWQLSLVSAFSFYRVSSLLRFGSLHYWSSQFSYTHPLHHHILQMTVDALHAAAAELEAGDGGD